MATINLLQKSDLIEDLVPFPQTVQDRQIKRHIKQALELDLFELLECASPLHADILALDTVDDVTFSPQQSALYAYYIEHIKPYCVVQSYYNWLQVGDSHATPSGNRTFVEPQSNVVTDSTFAGLVASERKYLAQIKNKMLRQLQTDNWQIGDVTYEYSPTKLTEATKSNTGFSVIKPPCRK